MVDFSLFKLQNKIIDLKIGSTDKLRKNYIPANHLGPGLSLELNAYQSNQNIRKISLYRTLDPANSLSIRTMDLVKTVDIQLEGQLNNNILTITDEFLDLEEIPYADPLFYRVTVSRAVEYAKDIEDQSILVAEYAPSDPSKLIISSIVEATNPDAPKLLYGFDTPNEGRVENIILHWKKTVHNGKYHIYKMNAQGNWVKIHELASNDKEFDLLLADIPEQEGSLLFTDENSEAVYHHFKVDAENSAGMFNLKSNVISILTNNAIVDEQGIGSMIVENTNIIR